MAVLSSTSWFIIRLFIFFVVVSEAGRKSTTKCTTPGRALAQAVSRWLPVAAARVRTWV
jgi:hypothetical protein